MRKALWMILLAGVSGSAAADVWFEIGVNEKFTAYADPATIKKEGNITRMWNMFDYKAPQVTETGKKYLSVKLHYEYDCKDKRARGLAATSFAEHQAKGEKIADSNMSLPVRAVAPGSEDEMLLNYACSK